MIHTNLKQASDLNEIGTTGIYVSNIGVGCSTFGGSLQRFVKEEDSNAIIEKALNENIKYFDTAPHYGQGSSEKRLGSKFPYIQRESFVVSTKVGVKLIPGTPGNQRGGLDFASTEPFESTLDFSVESVKVSIEESLNRLGINKIDIVYIHDPDEAVILLDPNDNPYRKSHFNEVMDDLFPYLSSLKEQGVIGAIGVGINQWQMLCDFAKAGNFDCFLIANQLTLLNHQGTVENLVPICIERNISLIAGGVFHNGILATGSKPINGINPFYNIGDAPPNIISKVKQIEKICNDFDISLLSAALQFPSLFTPVASTLTGVRNTNELNFNKAAFEENIPNQFWNELNEQGLINI